MIKGFNHNRMALFKLFISTEKKKVKRHTEHFTSNTNVSSRCKVGFSTPLICTKCYSILQIQQIKCSSVWGFLWKNCVLRPLLVRKRGEKGVSYRLGHVSSARKQRSNTNLFPPWPPSLWLHLFPLLCQSATVLASTDHPVAQVDWTLTEWTTTIIQIFS